MTNNIKEIVLSVEHLKKRIKKKWIIKDVSFEVHAGEVFGFLGPNGAGKTTTIRMLVDLIKPTDGVVKVCGYPVHRQPEQALKYVGSIVENPEMYSYLTGFENLEHFARMQPGITEERINEVAEIVGLDQRIHEKVSTYSLGMRQRLGIAQALLGDPKLLILDEPTNGLDPKGIKELRAFIRKLADEGLAVFVSSHLLSEIQLMCDRVAIISNGEILTVGKVDELIEDHSNITIWHLSPKDEGVRWLLSHPQVRALEDASMLDDTLTASLGNNAIITEMPEGLIPDLVRTMVRAGIKVEGVQKVNPTLEQLFLKMTEGERFE
ncbi:ABC transporter ATP-binding protein [Paenibacillus sp. 453mf]|uniref:ABC transporter ATP-binding protein n=1 Tax=Paenibacillus sp. 453mf TaxID=1761874 RepID=UPI0008E0FD74|nr:ABC transporter ATP-binding protein [Paenibacillus sp. 453mf]SFS58683.1 ABC-2 type transport system ATP-binding protein [Paenibacillus sp. 453mf]